LGVFYRCRFQQHSEFPPNPGSHVGCANVFLNRAAKCLSTSSPHPCPYSKHAKNQYNTDMSYPIHFRKRILAKLEEGQSIRAVAQHFEIDKNTIVEWKKPK
jgi:hypothetical protein